jgi:MoxR-like ATPase
MSAVLSRHYVGDGKRAVEPLPDAYATPEFYQASQALADAVNIALYLRRPLLLEGDPGVGKTRLAYAVAYELGLPLKTCYIRSTSRAQDLLYTYDAVRRLYDLQEYGARRGDFVLPPRRDYVTLGRLGEAIASSQNGTPSVVLIDEIDKADIDFPNDLLLVLDRYQFEIDELKPNRNFQEDSGDYQFDALQGKKKEECRDILPLVIVTSNREKELPAPFLRRCLYFYIEFPSPDEMRKIVVTQFGAELSALFQAALNKFWELRQLKTIVWHKPPSTSELLDWLALIQRDELQNTLSAADLAATPLKKLPYLHALVKMNPDMVALAALPD